ncbi:ribosome biogenesis protein SPATA5 [Wyeomyia smithii]|uniref:ribosome biogenesis protein SPATA5 n=1 Tax=Wyeomyia smithii TaxID=174621 RepID=UPI002467E34B|nr:ribosome biogenesis protein SPATA5 [Wyeomyia smithii]
MPPKSAKKEKTGWWKCERCQFHVLVSELTQHQSEGCQKTDALSGFITSTGVFHSRSVEITNVTNVDDLKDIGEPQSSALILFSRTVMDKLNLVLGDLVEITIIGGESGSSTFVRKAWPIEEKNGSRVIMVHSGETQIFSVNISDVCIKLFREPVKDANEVILSLQDVSQSDQIVTNQQTFERLLRRQYFGRVVSELNTLSLKLCNKLFVFKIAKVNLKQTSNQEEIETRLQNLSLTNKYFYINRETKLVIGSEQRSDLLNTKQRDYSTENIGGIDSVIREIIDIVNLALGKTNQPPRVPVNRGVLVYGVSGVGKTLLVDSIAHHMQCNTIRIRSTEIFSRFYGESENNIAQLFNKSFSNYPEPTIIIVEEIQNLCPKSEASDIVRRISNFFVNLLDSLHTREQGSRSIVLATTDNVDNLNPALRRSGRMEYEFEVPVPSAEGREQILSKILSSHRHTMTQEEVKNIARVTHGFVGADLVSLVGRAMHETKAPIGYSDMISALQFVKASAMREILIECPEVHWDDIGGQDDLKLKLRQIIEWPIHRPEIFARLGISPPRGLLMFGPPGCSKTMIAKAIATESKVNFLSIKGSELFSMWVGESERAVRELFRKARQVAPSIIFFDEIDAIGGERSADGGGSSVKERVLAQILTEIDGVSALKNVKIVAATNRPDLIDKALMRPGRLDRIIYVGLPDAKTREEIFRIKLAKIPTSEDVSLPTLVCSTDGYSGSEIEALCQEAVMEALEESFDTLEIGQKYFDRALRVVKPRTSPDLLQLYEDYLKQHQ